MGPIGTTEILLVVGIIVLLFGPKKIPELMSGLGKGIKEFKKAQQEGDKSITDNSSPKKDGSQENRTS
jgi:sec-independent protein translocase protein TatA